MKVGYVRVSTVDQNESRQLVRMKEAKVEKLYIEKVSGKDIEGRPELKNMLEFVREGDTVYVHDFSRLARSTKDLLHITDLLAKKKVHLVSFKENIDTS
ncbi:recombinase family protein, partial [Cetobacterium sp.]